MTINFIPNDPLAVSAVPMRQKTPHADRPANRAGFIFSNIAPEGLFNPGTPQFLFWQCREAALLAVEVWEALAGPLTKWARATPNIKKLRLLQDNGDDLNAFYNGQSLSFFHHPTGSKTTFSGASTDVVAHESGHGFLDVIRPDLWSSMLTETGAFHEAFGDCMALLTAFSDQISRQKLLSVSPTLTAQNFLEATAEDLSDGVRRALGATHPAAKPRHAFNNFQWQLPTTLPTSGGPDVLTSEVHSFARVFSGCFYDTVSNIFAAAPVKNEAALLKAAQTAGKLLIAGAKGVPLVPRFFQAVGRAMVLADQTMNAGANHTAIVRAFARHSIALGSSAMLAPRATLAGNAPKFAAKGQILSAATTKDLKRRMGAAASARLAMSAVEIGGDKVAQAVHSREVSLGSLSNQLKGVVAVVTEPVLVGASGGRAAAVSAMPDSSATNDEVLTFVETLLKNDHIDLGTEKKGAAASSRKAVVASETSARKTHTIRTRGGKKTLERLGFVCRHCG